jgi:galactose-1-phosphate uridylyltransferase
MEHATSSCSVDSTICYDNNVQCVIKSGTISNVQCVIKSAVNETLGTMKKRNRRKFLKMWDDQIKQLIEKKTSYKNGLIQGN